MGAPKPPKITLKNVEGFIETVFGQGSKKLSKKGKTPNHTGRFEIDVTGSGEKIPFEFEDAVKLIRAKQFAENREVAADAAEAIAEAKTAAVTSAARIRDQDRAAARQARAEAKAAMGSDQADAKNRLAEEAEAKAELSQGKFQTLDDDAAHARALAIRRRTEADEADDKLAAVAGETKAEERAKLIDQAIQEAEAKAVKIEYEQRADEIVGKLTQATEDYQQALRIKRQQMVDLNLAKKRLAQAELNEKRPGTDREAAAQEVTTARAELEALEILHKDAEKPVSSARGMRRHWSKIADDFLADPASELNPSQREAVQRAKDAADHAADALAVDKADQKVIDLVNRLERKTAQYDKAGLEMEEARRADVEAQRLLREATGDQVETAQAKAKTTAEAYRKALGKYLSDRSGRMLLRQEAERLLDSGVDDEARAVLEAALNTSPVLSLQERLLEAVVERDADYAKLAQAQQRWREAVIGADASADPQVEAAAAALKQAKTDLASSVARITALRQGMQNTLNDPNMAPADRDALESILATAKETNAERQTIYILDALSESHLKKETDTLARNEAREAWEVAQRNLEEIKQAGGNIVEGQERVVQTKQAYDKAEAKLRSDRSAVYTWNERYESLIPDEQIVAVRRNEDAAILATKIEQALANHPALTLAQDQANVLQKEAVTRLRQLELQDDNANADALEAARTEVRETAIAFTAAARRVSANREHIDLWSERADELIHSDETALVDSNRIRLQGAIDQASNRLRSPGDVANLLKAAVTRHNVEYDAVAKAQKQMQEAREYFTLAHKAGDGVADAEIAFREAQEALKEAEKNIYSSALQVTGWERQANRLLERTDLPSADRQAIENALAEAKQIKEAREPEFIRNSFAEKQEQKKEALAVLTNARETRDAARADLEKARETGVKSEIEIAQAKLEETQDIYEAAAKVNAVKFMTYDRWRQKAIAVGLIVGAAAMVSNPDTASASPTKPQASGSETQVDREAREKAQLRVFAEKNNSEWQAASKAYETAEKAVFPHGTDNDEALGYINKASLEEMEALNRATIQLEKAELLVQAQTQSLIQARQESRQEAERREATADHQILVRHTDANLRKAKAEYQEATTQLEELKARVGAEERLEAATTEMVEAEAGAEDVAGMQQAAGSFGISPEELANSEQAHQERLVEAKSKLAEAQANVAAVKVQQKTVVPEGMNSKELLASKQVEQRVQEGKYVAATVAADKTEDLYVKEQVRLRREDSEVGVANWAKEALTAREQREAKREDRLKKAAQGIMEPISEEEKELGLGYDPKSGNFTNFEEIKSNLTAKVGQWSDPDMPLAYYTDARFLTAIVENYEKMSGYEKALFDQILTPELKEFALVAYNVKEAHQEIDKMELDQRASNDLHDSGVFIPYQKTPEKLATKPDPRIAEAPKQLGSSKSKQKTWDSLNTPTPAAQNFTPNVSESPDVNFSGSEYEEAMSVEQNIEQTSIPVSIAKATVPKC